MIDVRLAGERIEESAFVRALKVLVMMLTPRFRILATFMFLLLLGGCGMCTGRRAAVEAPGPASQSPVSPLSGPRAQTPVTPLAQASQTPTRPIGGGSPEETAAAEDGQGVQFTLDMVNAIEPGMMYHDIYDRLGAPGVVIAGTDSSNQVYRWSHSGISFMGRFEDGVLTRKQIIDMGEDRAAPLDEEVLRFDRVLYDSIAPGMTYDEVMGIIGADAQALTKSNPDSIHDVVLYMWTDGHGSTITGRFEDQILTRKSGMIADAGDTPWAELPEADDQADDAHAEAYEDDRPHAPEEQELIAMPEQDRGVSTAPGAAAPERRPARVHVAGVSRREREAPDEGAAHSGRSYHPRARFPEFTRSLRRGVYEIRIHNTTDTGVKVAVVSDEGGLEFSIPAGSRKSVHVNQGAYSVYFIYDDDPHSLHRGQTIPISETLADFSVYIIGNSYDVRFLDRTHEPAERPSRRR